jgi:hypothetical protein
LQRYLQGVDTGASIVGIVYGSDPDAGEIESNETLMQEAQDPGKQLVDD